MPLMVIPIGNSMGITIVASLSFAGLKWVMPIFNFGSFLQMGITPFVGEAGLFFAQLLCSFLSFCSA